MNREIIYAALFARLAGLPGIVTASRRLKHWTDVAPAQQPALFQVQKGETAESQRGQPAKWTLAVDLYLYSHAGGGPDALPSQVLNGLLDAVEAAVAPDPSSGEQTLGGLVSHCRIGGRIETDEGVLGDQAVAILPIEIVTA